MMCLGNYEEVWMMVRWEFDWRGGQIIIMEEQQALQVINVFLRSSEIDQLNIDIFDSCDALVSSFPLSNYKRHTIHLQSRLPHFYCLLNNSARRIEEQLEVKMSEDHLSSFQLCRKFSSFSIAVEVELHKPLQAQFLPGEFLKQQSQVLRFANAHLRKLKETVIKRLEVQELKKPITQTCRNAKVPTLRKPKRKLNFTTLAKLPEETEKKSFDRTIVETLRSLGKNKNPPSEESEPSVEEHPSNQPTRREKKFNTFFECSPVFTSNETSRKDLATGQQPVVDPEPDHFVKALLSPYPMRPFRAKLLRESRLSHNQQLLACTLGEIEKQKKALEIIKSMSGKYSQENSPVKQQGSKIAKHKRSSPYLPLSSKTFLKRKAK